MKKIVISLLTIVTLCFICNNVFADYKREGTTFVASGSSRSKTEPTKTKFTYKGKDNKEYPIYISSTGSCFIMRISSKTNKEYRSYLGSEISQEICKELGIEYKSKKK